MNSGTTIKARISFLTAGEKKHLDFDQQRANNRNSDNQTTGANKYVGGGSKESITEANMEIVKTRVF